MKTQKVNQAKRLLPLGFLFAVLSIQTKNSYLVEAGTTVVLLPKTGRIPKLTGQKLVYMYGVLQPVVEKNKSGGPKQLPFEVAPSQLYQLKPKVELTADIRIHSA